jgi:hypothetical protein
MERGIRTMKTHFVKGSFDITIKSEDMDAQKEGDGRRATKAMGYDTGDGWLIAAWE